MNLSKILTGSTPYALIILNQPLNLKIFTLLWAGAQKRVVADGGADRLLSQNATLIPDEIVGDLDSIKSATLNYYKEKGCVITHLTCQDTTDFTKCLSKTSGSVVALGAPGGRFDHSMASINALYCNLDRDILLINNESQVLLARAGKTEFFIDTAIEGPTCGLLPIGCSVAKVKTEGFKWYSLV